MLNGIKNKIILGLSISLILCLVYIFYTNGKYTGSDEKYREATETIRSLEEDNKKSREELKKLGDIQKELDSVRSSYERLRQQRQAEVEELRKEIEEFRTEIKRRDRLAEIGGNIIEAMGRELQSSFEIMGEGERELQNIGKSD